MARPWRILYAGAKYHVTVRGNARQEVFHEERDYLRFIEQLSEKAEHKDHVWTWDFIHDRTTDGRPLKWLSIVDEYDGY